MRIIARSKLIDYYSSHPEEKVALEDWYQKTKNAEWHCFTDVKNSFKTVDAVGNQHYVFNIKGNDFRLVVVIKMTISLVLIRFIGTHTEYDKIDVRNI